MITAVDTNILFDILIPDEDFVQSSKKMMERYAEKGQLIICEIVYAELASQFPSPKELRDFLSDTGIRLVYSSEETLSLAGKRWKAYSKNRDIRLQCPKCGKRISISCPACRNAIFTRQHIISDFIIGAHALKQAEILISRDRGFYKAYFKDLKIG